jgi:putative membrane protein (TIGR04086 family)
VPKKEKEKKPVKKRTEETSDSRALKMLKGMAAAYAITCIVFIAYGILLTFTGISEERIPLVALLCTAVSSAVAGFDWAKCADKKGIVWGLLAGLVYGIILFLAEAFAGNGIGITASKCLMLLIAMAGGGIGGILGINMKKA